jgi:hypothetical protein
MCELPRTIPDVKVLLALAPEELAVTILFHLKKRNEAKFHTGDLQRELWYYSTLPRQTRRFGGRWNLIAVR